LPEGDRPAEPYEHDIPCNDGVRVTASTAPANPIVTPGVTDHIEVAKVKSQSTKASRKQAARSARSEGNHLSTCATLTSTGEKVIHDSHEGSEIIVGLVEAVGTDSKAVIDQITDCLRPYKYKVQTISVSSGVMPSLLKIQRLSASNEGARLRILMDAGDLIRELFQHNGILAFGATSMINLQRKRIEQRSGAEKWPGYAKRTAFIIKSLKRPEEVEHLRRVYGPGFYLIGIYTEEDRRIDRLRDKGVVEADARTLSARDADGHSDYGQKASETYHLADFFLHFGDSQNDLKAQVERVVKLMFGHPHVTPLFDEYAMFMAFAASLRSADLARQVGAVVARGYEIVATGANDCPKRGGGLYWTEYDNEKHQYSVGHPQATDADRGYDSNSREKAEIIKEIANGLANEMECSVAVVKAFLEKSRLKDITEYGRSVHAEMEALMHCARNSTSTRGADLYCTTFPCHNCAKHIVAAGIKRVVYVEPYPKSKAIELHDDAISRKSEDSQHRVVFVPFRGVGPRRFFDLFSMRLGMGSQLDRKDLEGNKVVWREQCAEPRIRLSPLASLEHEKAATRYYDSRIKGLEHIFGKELRQVSAAEVARRLRGNDNGDKKG
jgi:deoxycytidylate deaminase